MLRKQTNHVSFLHVYHHAVMMLTGYAGTRFIPGGQASMLVIINCFVHIFMYTYYLGCSLNVSAPWMKWSKRYITRLQLVSHIYIYVVYKGHIIFRRFDFFHACISSENTGPVRTVDDTFLPFVCRQRLPVPEGDKFDALYSKCIYDVNVLRFLSAYLHTTKARQKKRYRN